MVPPFPVILAWPHAGVARLSEINLIDNFKILY
jgi:hypothetical protein